MRPRKFTQRDPTLTHQVVIVVAKGSFHIHVSCNCLETVRHGHESMGVTTSLEESRRLYNNPANHRVEFTPNDYARW